MLTYVTRLIAPEADIAALIQMLHHEKDAFNLASKEQFPEKRRSIIILHSKAYHKIRAQRPEICSAVILCAEYQCLSAYRAIQTNRHQLDKPVEKKRLSMRLNSKLYAKNTKKALTYNKTGIRISTTEGRKMFKFALYPKLSSFLNRYSYRDPLIFERDKGIWVALTFDVPNLKSDGVDSSLGIDLGCRVSAATSDGHLIIDKKFAKEKRSLRFLKRTLRSCADRGSKTAKRHLKRLRRKEAHKNKNQTHLIANTILKTDANTLVLENLKSIKVKKHKFQNKNRISQVPLFELRRILTYKAGHMGKRVMLVCPSYTSQTDSLTGKREGERRGRRFYAKSGLIYDSDVNAAVNIAKLSKLPYTGPSNRLLAGQAIASRPNACGSHV